MITIQGCFRSLPGATALLVGLSATVRAQTVLIIGANRGIGLEFARQYAARGWTVVATHCRDTPPAELVSLRKQYPQVPMEKMNVTDHGEIDGPAAKMKRVSIDILINNATLKGHRAVPETRQNR